MSSRTVDAFYELLSGFEVIRTIRALFEAESIIRKDGYVSPVSGQRRALADEYVKSLDLANPTHMSQLLRAMTTFTIKHQQNEWLQKSQDWTGFTKLMQLDGYELKDTGWRPVQAASNLGFEQLANKYGLEYVRQDWDRAQAQVSTDPEDAITAARSMLESTCKWILDQRGVSYTEGQDLPALYKSVAAELQLAPDQHGEQQFRQILGSVMSVVGGLGGLRNRYGDAHGKGTKYYRPAQRHAQLAVGLAGALCMFLADTHVQRYAGPVKSEKNDAS